MAKQIIFITGTDTDAGKTVFAAQLTRRLRGRGVAAVALKPICAGGREDAVAFRNAAGKTLSLDEINPWHFREPLAPLLAAHNENKRIKLSAVVAHIRAVQKEFEVLVVEGAGGLLSPLGEGFDSRDLLLALCATPIVVCPNRLGAVNQLRLVWEALPAGARREAHGVLVEPSHKQLATRTNRSLLEEFISANRLHDFPWQSARAAANRTHKCLDLLLDAIR